MDKLFSVLQTALPVFAALGLGMLCRSKDFLTRQGVDALKKVVVNITLPAVLFHAFASTAYTKETIILPFTVYLLCILALGLGFAAIRIFRIKSRLAPFLASGFEAGMLGYALFALLFPNKSTSHFAILDLGQTLFVFTLYKILLSGKRSGKAIVRDMVTSPILWAVFAGVLAGATGLYNNLGNFQPVLDSLTDFISAPTAMIILLAVGYDLVLREISWRKTAGLIVMRLVIMAVWLISLLALDKFLLGSTVFAGAAVLMCILPPPYVIPVFADEPEERVQISSALSALTLVTILLFAAYSIFLGLQ